METFKDRLSYGKEAEMMIADYLSQHGWVAFSPVFSGIEPFDLAVCKDSKIKIVEVKRKSKLNSCNGIALDCSKILHYLNVSATNNIDLELAVLETTENKLYFQNINDIIKSYSDESGFNYPDLKMIPNAMVFSLEAMDYCSDFTYKDTTSFEVKEAAGIVP